MNEVAHGVGAFTVLLGAAVLIAVLAERVRVPAAVAMVAVGALFPMAPPFAFGDTLLFVFLPPLIFEAAWNLDLGVLRRLGWRIAALAAPGTVVTALIVGGGLALLGVLPFGPALLFGAIVAATDPVAVVSAFRRVPVPPDLRTLIEGESLSNDGVALVLFPFALALALGQPVSLGADALTGLYQIAAGALIGAVFGVVCAIVLRATATAEHEVTVTIVLAYLTYLTASGVHCSGIFATAAGAIALRAMTINNPSAISNEYDVDRAWSALAFVANAVVFIGTGLLIQPARILYEPALVLAAIVTVTLARVLLALVATRDYAGRITVFLAGMRGALPLALALSLPEALPSRPQIIDATFAVVLVTIVVQGAPLEVVLKRLYAKRVAGGEV